MSLRKRERMITISQCLSVQTTMTHFRIFFWKRVTWVTMCWHINLISAKRKSPYRICHFFWVDTNKNLFDREIPACNLDMCNMRQKTWRFAVLKAGRHFALLNPAVQVVVTQALCLSEPLWACPDPCPRFLSFEFFLIWILLSFPSPSQYLTMAGVSLGLEWQNVENCFSHRFWDWWSWWWQGANYFN